VKHVVTGLFVTNAMCRGGINQYRGAIYHVECVLMHIGVNIRTGRRGRWCLGKLCMYVESNSFYYL